MVELLKTVPSPLIAVRAPVVPQQAFSISALYDALPPEICHGAYSKSCTVVFLAEK